MVMRLTEAVRYLMAWFEYQVAPDGLFRWLLIAAARVIAVILVAGLVCTVLWPVILLAAQIAVAVLIISACLALARRLITRR